MLFRHRRVSIPFHSGNFEFIPNFTPSHAITGTNLLLLGPKRGGVFFQQSVPYAHFYIPNFMPNFKKIVRAVSWESVSQTHRHTQIHRQEWFYSSFSGKPEAQQASHAYLFKCICYVFFYSFPALLSPYHDLDFINAYYLYSTRTTHYKQEFGFGTMGITQRKIRSKISSHKKWNFILTPS